MPSLQQRHPCPAPHRPVLGCSKPLHWAALALLLSLLTLISLPAHAKRMALVVGNAAYQGETVLRNPVNDATDMAQTLGGLGLQVFEGKAHTDQSRQAMNALIGRFLNAAESAELAVVFYAGHGMQSGESTYLIPTDARITDERSVRSEGLSLNDLLADVADKRISRLVVILDACRNNPYTTRTRSTVRGLGRPPETNGTLIAYATAHGQVADDGVGRNGVYTEQLLKQLRANGQRKSIRDLLEDTQLAVAQAKPAQRPKVYGDSALFRDVGLSGSIQLASVGVEGTGRPLQADAEQEAWEIAKRRDTVASYQVYLNRYPSGRYAQTARDALEGLQPKTIATPTPAPAPRPVQQAVLQAAIPATQPPAQASLQPGQAFRDCTGAHCPELVVIPAGSFVMGSNERDTEKPPRSVSVRSFALGKYEVTQGQWKAVMGSNPSTYSDCGDNCPVENVSWEDIQQYLAKLNGMTGMKYRLASEAEWEYAARAGSTSKYWWGETASHEYANYGKDECCWGLAQGRDKWEFTAPVGQFPANGFGLHDMHGNVWEWVEDVWHDNYGGAPIDGSAWVRGGDQSRRVLRGGSWNYFPDFLRSAFRDRITPGNRSSGSGFRIARTVP